MFAWWEIIVIVPARAIHLFPMHDAFIWVDSIFEIHADLCDLKTWTHDRFNGLSSVLNKERFADIQAGIYYEMHFAKLPHIFPGVHVHVQLHFNEF